MASEASSSFLAPSTTQVSASAQSKSKKTKDASVVWDHCRTARDDEDPEEKYCNYCTNESRKTIYSSNNSSNMHKHIRTIHNIEIKLAISKIQQTASQQLRELYQKAKAAGETNEINTQALRNYLNQDVINEALISLIVVRNLPYASVEWPKLHAFA
jgi:BED zinc finger